MKKTSIMILGIIGIIIIGVIGMGVMRFVKESSNKTSQLEQQLPIIDEKTEVQNYIITLNKEVLSLMGQASEKMFNASQLGIKQDFTSAKKEIDLTKLYYEQAQTKLNLMTPPTKLILAQDLIKKALSKYTLAATILATGIDQNNLDKLDEGIKMMTEGTAFVNQAGDEIIRVKKELQIQ
jgi:hypothetical protein